MLKKVISVFMSVLLLCLPLSAGASAESKAEYAVKISVPDASQCAEAAAYLQRAVKSVYGIELGDSAEKYIEFRAEAEPLDYSVEFDEKTGNAVITGGSPEAYMRAVYAFLTAVCAENSETLIVTDNINYKFDYSEDAVDNSDLLEYRPADKDSLVNSWTDGLLESPDWLDGLTLVEVRLDTASIGGTFDEAYDLLDFYASVGVNGIWLTPIYDKGAYGNGYSNYGLHTVDPRLTGTEDYDDGWQKVCRFVDYAHSKGIYIFLDVITWGVVFNAPLVSEHPDWFNGEAWGNIAFDWSNGELRSWFTDNLVKNILVTDADGYRCDCEPNYTGYDIFGAARERLAENGKYIAVISEDTGTRKSVYDFEQDGVLDYASMDRAALYQNPVNFFTDGYLNIVDSVRAGEGIGSYNRDGKKLKRGKSRYYTNCITNHDYQKRNVCGNRLKIGYSAILAPFIPIWYMGDEFNASWVDAVQYDIPVNYGDMNIPSNAFFLEDVRQMLRIRRTYGDIFEKWTLNHRNSNICEVKAGGLDSLQNYARYDGNRAVLVIANNDPDAVAGKVKIPFSECGISGYRSYTVTDLMTGRVILSGTKKEIDGFTAAVPYQYTGVYLVEGSEKKCLSLNINDVFSDISEAFISIFVRIVSLFK